MVLSRCCHGAVMVLSWCCHAFTRRHIFLIRLHAHHAWTPSPTSPNPPRCAVQSCGTVTTNLLTYYTHSEHRFPAPFTRQESLSGTVHTPSVAFRHLSHSERRFPAPSTFRTSLSGTFHTPSVAFRHISHSEHRFPAPSTLRASLSGTFLQLCQNWLRK